MRFKRATWRAFAVGFALLVSAHAASARQLPEAGAQLDADGRWVNGVTESWWPDDGITRDDAAAAAARWKEIGDELARSGGGAWAGDYFRGSDTHGTYMRWSPAAGFVIARVDKCRAAVMGITFGRVEATPTLVRFFPELDKRSPHGHGGRGHAAAAPREVIRFVPVGWRGERLLVSEEEMGEFGDYVAGVGSYNGWNDVFIEHTVFFSHSGAGSVEPERGAPPAVPPGYERFLKRPVEAAVTSVGRKVFRREYMIVKESFSRGFGPVSLTYVTLDAGAVQGVKDRMVFRATRPDEGDTVVVVRAGRRSSTAVVVREVDEHGRETFYASQTAKPHSKVTRGWKLTTSPR